MAGIAPSIGFALLLLALPALAQGTIAPLTGLTAPTLEGSFPDLPKPPTPKDQYGKDIQVQPPTPAEREVARKDEALRAENRRAEEERQAGEARRAAEEGRAAEHLAEEKGFHNRLMTAVYVGLAIMAAIVGLLVSSRRRKRS